MLPWRSLRQLRHPTLRDAGMSSHNILMRCFSVDSMPSALLRQVRSYQLQHPHQLLLTRVGDFYEAYFSQADIMGRALSMSVVDKKFKQMEDAVRFTGFPARNLEKYVQVLVKEHGMSVAVNEQFQDPVTRVFERRVVRVVTPGTWVEEEGGTENRFVMAMFIEKEAPGAEDGVGMAWMDVGTGEFYVKTSCLEDITSDLHLVRPLEVVMAPTVREVLASRIKVADPMSVPELNDEVSRSIFSNLSSSEFDTIMDHSSSISDLESSVSELSMTPIEKKAGCLLFRYLRQATHLPMTTILPRKISTQETMQMDANAVEALELVRNARDGGRRDSLIGVVDRTVTKAGARLLHRRILAPSSSLKVIQARLNSVEEFVQVSTTMEALRTTLRELPDVARALSRLEYSRGCVRDASSVFHFLKRCQDVLRLLDGFQCVSKVKVGHEEEALVEFMGSALIFEDANQDGDICSERNSYINPSAIACSISTDLVKLHEALATARGEQAHLQETLRTKYAASSLKLVCVPNIRHVAEVLPRDSPHLQHARVELVQMLKGKHRYRIQEWVTLAERIESLEANIRAEELALFRRISNTILQSRRRLMELAHVMAEVDVASSLAVHAREHHYVRPIVDASSVIDIVNGRHPLVERNLELRGLTFTRNTCHIDASNERTWLITGPNMGGKSTFLRQNAIVCILAQIGSFVPASSAHIGIVDRLFTRIGASDNLARDQSTFFVEMSETSHILARATKRSFVIMDEIGRGTSPEDGLALAHAVLKHLHGAIQCRMLFATHYHELGWRTRQVEGVGHYQTQVEENEGEFVFLHSLIPGISSNSHGLLVARLAGIPESVVQEAENFKQQHLS